MSEAGCGATIEAVWQQVGADPRGEKVIKKIFLTSVGKFDQVELDMLPKCEKRARTKQKKTCLGQKASMQWGSVTLMKKLEKEINKLLDKEAQMWG